MLRTGELLDTTAESDSMTPLVEALVVGYRTKPVTTVLLALTASSKVMLSICEVRFNPKPYKTGLRVSAT